MAKNWSRVSVSRALGAVLLTAVVSAPAFGSTKTSIRVDNAAGGAGLTSAVKDEDTTGLLDGPSISSGRVENTVRQALGYSEAIAHATEGKLGISIATHASTTDRSTYNSFNGTAEAQWIDYVTFTAPAGTTNTLRIRGNLVLEGGVYGEAAATIRPTSGTATLGSIALDGVGIADYEGSRRADARGVVVDSLPDLEVIPFEITARSGSSQYLRFTLTAFAVSTADATNARGQSAWATGLVDYGHTLRWNGITSITDYWTGESVEGVTVTSRSGFDYLNAAPVPEPSVYAYALGGLSVLAFAVRRRQAVYV